MDFEFSSENVQNFIFEIDGSKSEPFTPRAPEEQARFAKAREKYLQALQIAAENALQSEELRGATHEGQK
jgi:hypothetical protein